MKGEQCEGYFENLFLIIEDGLLGSETRNLTGLSKNVSLIRLD